MLFRAVFVGPKSAGGSSNVLRSFATSTSSATISRNAFINGINNNFLFRSTTTTAAAAAAGFNHGYHSFFGTRSLSTLTSFQRSSIICFTNQPLSYHHHHQQQQQQPKQQFQFIGHQLRYYTPMNKEEEEQEKARVSHLSKEEKDVELRKLNREIARLETLRGINTGELYTWSGRYKSLMRDYGFPLFVYYWVVWSLMGVSVYLAIDIGGLDAMDLLARVDDNFGWNLSDKVDPQLGKIGLVLMINELLEPVRLPLVITTLKPAMDTISPPKY
jgi:hypothetical protein